MQYKKQHEQLVIWLVIKLQPYKKSPQNTSEALESETELPKERYISPEERQQIIDELRLIK